MCTHSYSGMTTAPSLNWSGPKLTWGLSAGCAKVLKVLRETAGSSSEQRVSSIYSLLEKSVISLCHFHYSVSLVEEGKQQGASAAGAWILATPLPALWPWARPLLSVPHFFCKIPMTVIVLPSRGAVKNKWVSRRKVHQTVSAAYLALNKVLP